MVAPAADEEPASPRRASRILVIDDEEEEVREVLADLLRSDGHSVVERADGASAIRALEQEQFDLVVTDLGMPDVSGWDVAGEVKRRQPRTPVALVTGWGATIDREDASARGVDFILGKPFRGADVRRTIERAVRRGPVAAPDA